MVQNDLTHKQIKDLFCTEKHTKNNQKKKKINYCFSFMIQNYLYLLVNKLNIYFAKKQKS